MNVLKPGRAYLASVGVALADVGAIKHLLTGLATEDSLAIQPWGSIRDATQAVICAIILLGDGVGGAYRTSATASREYARECFDRGISQLELPRYDIPAVRMAFNILAASH